MTRTTLADLAPALVVALGILAATAVAATVDASAALATAAALPLAFAVLVADALRSRLAGRPALPTGTAYFLAAVLLVACGLVALADPAHVATMLPVLGAGFAITVVPGLGGRRRCHRDADVTG